MVQESEYRSADPVQAIHKPPVGICVPNGIAPSSAQPRVSILTKHKQTRKEGYQ